MTNPATPSAATADFFAVLRRARAVRDAAKRACVAILPRQCARIAMADPTDADSLADAVEEADHVPLLAVAHGSVVLRRDGWIIPAGSSWEASDGESGWMDTDGDPDDDPEEIAEGLLDDIEPGERSINWTYTVRIQGVNPRGWADEIEATSSRDVHPDEPECWAAGGHDWRSPRRLVGGCESNPGVWASGHGSVYYKEVCRYCGAAKTTDCGATNPQDGSQMTTVEYDEADGDTRRWAASKGDWEYTREGRAVRARLLHGGEEIATCIVRIGDENALEIDEDSREAFHGFEAEDVDWPDEAVAWRKVWG